MMPMFRRRTRCPHPSPYQGVHMDTTLDVLAQRLLDLREDDIAVLELATETETDAFAAFASDYVAIVPPGPNGHVPCPPAPSSRAGTRPGRGPCCWTALRSSTSPVAAS